MPDLIGPILNDPLVHQIGSDALSSATDALVNLGVKKGGVVLARFFKLRFLLAPEDEITLALERLDSFTHLLDSRIERLEKLGFLDANDLDKRFRQPGITAALGSAFDCAVETDQSLKQAALAGIVAQRLASDEQGLAAKVTRLAIAAIRDLTVNELRLVGLIHLLHMNLMAGREINDNNVATERSIFASSLHVYVEPLVETPVGDFDLQHLRALGVIQYDDTATMMSLGTPRVLSSTVIDFPGPWEDPNTTKLIKKITERSHGDIKRGVIPLQKCTVSPMGIAIAMSVLSDIVGAECDLQTLFDSQSQ
ncbi:MAG TPA: LPO_1073/Vpar_1526 family protein [Candidatus Dormibacteraeota bacterium]|nr:LPO_1073/Vpar_1526 family protein [Candidatus Dormibacteraeota bacterium]